MSGENTRYIQEGDWVFEVKTVRAMRVDEFGKPYSAIANCNLNGNSMYIDGLLTNELDFSKDDFMTFHRFCKRMGLDNFTYHRYHNGESSSKTVRVNKPIPVSAPATITKLKQDDESADKSPTIRVIK